MSTVWAVPTSYFRRGHILSFLREERCATRVVEVKLFQSTRLYQRTPVASRFWQPSQDLTKTAQEIAEYIADNAAIDATIVVADES